MGAGVGLGHNMITCVDALCGCLQVTYYSTSSQEYGSRDTPRSQGVIFDLPPGLHQSSLVTDHKHPHLPGCGLEPHSISGTFSKVKVFLAIPMIALTTWTVFPVIADEVSTTHLEHPQLLAHS